MKLSIDLAELQPLIERVVEETIARMQHIEATLPQKMAFSEPEAARLLSMQPHQLRDERRRGRIKASAVVCRRIRYSREDLVEYLKERRS